MKRKTIGDFFNDLSEGKYSPLRSLFMVKGCAVLVLFILSMSAVYAQPKSQCVIEDNGQGSVLECDVSFTTLLTEAGGTMAANVWVPNSTSKTNINKELNRFADVWCNATAANSRIREISVHTDGTNADFWLLKEIGRSGAYAGYFPHEQPSSVIFYDKGMEDSGDVGNVIAHEFGHSALKIYDEYQQFGRFIRLARCSSPLHTDDARDTLMSNHTRNFRFSYSGDYPRRDNIRTAQWACYGKSAWDILIQSVHRDARTPLLRTKYLREDYFFRMSVDVPDATQLMASGDTVTYSCVAPTINWISSTNTTNPNSPIGNTVTVMIDHSASMGDDQRLALAQRAVKEAIDLLYVEERPVAVAIVGFDDVARTEIAPTPLDSTENLRMIKSAIDALVADGGTDYGAALEHVQTVFAAANSGGQKVLIIISDGETEQADLDYFKANKILVYTVELDTEGKVVLQDAITEARSRLNMEVDAQRLTSFLPSVLRDTSLIRNNQLTTSVSFESESLDDRVTTTTLISPQSDSANFILRWNEETSFGSFTLQSPDGVTIDQSDAARVSTDSISYLEGTSQAIYTIESPLSGVWQVHISGRGRFEYETAVNSGIIAGISAGAELILQEGPSDVVVYPEPIPVLVRIGGIAPITYADVMAEVTMPDDSTMSVRLLDDGNAPDEIARDGLYSAMLADYSQDGICEIKVTASNLDGNAMYDRTSLIHHIEHDLLDSYVPAEVEAAPLFQRVVYDQVDVINTKEKFMRLSERATTITRIIVDDPPDTAAIERVGQVDWYQFSAMEGKEYYIQTSGLMPSMVTDLRLHETPDIDKYDDPIEEEVGNCGNAASSIEWIAFEDTDYFISVAAKQGTGPYKIAVSTEDNVMCDMRQDRSGGGFVGYPLLLLLLLAMIAWYRTRADLQVRRHPSL